MNERHKNEIGEPHHFIFPSMDCQLNAILKVSLAW